MIKFECLIWCAYRAQVDKCRIYLAKADTQILQMSLRNGLIFFFFFFWRQTKKPVFTDSSHIKPSNKDFYDRVRFHTATAFHNQMMSSQPDSNFPFHITVSMSHLWTYLGRRVTFHAEHRHGEKMILMGELFRHTDSVKGTGGLVLNLLLLRQFSTFPFHVDAREIAGLPSVPFIQNSEKPRLRRLLPAKAVDCVNRKHSTMLWSV